MCYPKDYIAGESCVVVQKQDFHSHVVTEYFVCRSNAFFLSQSLFP